VNVVELIAQCLVRLGVRHAFGVGGANIEDLFLAVQRQRPELSAVLCKHEHAAGCAADAYARLSGGLGVVMVTSGGGAMNLVHAVAEAKASRVALVALVGEPPTDQRGRGAFQDTSGQAGSVDALSVFGAITPNCTRLAAPRQVLAWLEQLASLPPAEVAGPRVLLLPKDIQRAEIVAPPGFVAGLLGHGWQRLPSAHGSSSVVRALRQRPVAIVAGAEVARAVSRLELARLAELLDAKVAVAPDARDAFDNAHPRFVGVVGAMGHPAATRALTEARSLLLVGTRLPLLARQGLDSCLAGKLVVSVGQERPFVECTAELPVRGTLKAELHVLANQIERARLVPDPDSHLTLPEPPGEPRLEAQPRGSGWSMRAALEVLERALPEDSSVLVDAGNTGASAVHLLPAPRRGRWLVAMGMAGMGYSFGAAIGAAYATRQRVFVVAGDGAFFMHGLELHTAVEHDLPITFLVLDNAAHGMCLVREQLLLGENSGYNVFRRSRLGAGLRAMFPGLRAVDCGSAGELERALAEGREVSGPCFISAQLPEVEVPPFAAFRTASGGASASVERGVAS